MTTEAEKERFERWAKSITSDAPNHQGFSREKPTDEEGFLRLTIILADEVDEGGAAHAGTKEFVVTHMLSDVVNRKRKYAEYFSTNPRGAKAGVSLEWCTREDAWKNTSDQELGQINKAVDKLVEDGLLK